MLFNKIELDARTKCIEESGHRRVLHRIWDLPQLISAGM